MIRTSGSRTLTLVVLLALFGASTLLAVDLHRHSNSDAYAMGPVPITGPYASLLASSTDLGPARSANVQFTAALRQTSRPALLMQWAEQQRLSVRWRPGDPWAIVEGDPAAAPYDVIILNGATEIVPERLFGQLAEGGRLVGVFAATKPSRAMIVTHSRGDFGHRTLFDAAAPVLPGLARHPEFVF